MSVIACEYTEEKQWLILIHYISIHFHQGARSSLNTQTTTTRGRVDSLECGWQLVLMFIPAEKQKWKSVHGKQGS